MSRRNAVDIGKRVVDCPGLPQLMAIAEAILSHHEHWDGSGSPRGLQGRDIPYISRVFALIDSYEYLT